MHRRLISNKHRVCYLRIFGLENIRLAWLCLHFVNTTTWLYHKSLQLKVPALSLVRYGESQCHTLHVGWIYNYYTVSIHCHRRSSIQTDRSHAVVGDNLVQLSKITVSSVSLSRAPMPQIAYMFWKATPDWFWVDAVHCKCTLTVVLLASVVF